LYAFHGEFPIDKENGDFVVLWFLTSVDHKNIFVVDTGVNHRISFDFDIKVAKGFVLNSWFKLILASIKSAAGKGNPSETPFFISK
jgi:hypothetical protein